MSRGAHLYADIWDHKDWGFIWISHPFYLAFGPFGLYLCGLAATAGMGAGISLLVKDYLRLVPSIALGCLAMATYAATPVYAPAFVPTLAIGLTVLALGLVRHSPTSSGLLLAAATSVKLSGVVLFAGVLIALLVPALVASPHWPSPSRAWKASAKLSAGFLAGLLVAVIGAWTTGSLSGWIEISRFNAAYSRSRGFPAAGSGVDALVGTATNAANDVATLLNLDRPMAITMLIVTSITIAVWIGVGHRSRNAAQRAELMTRSLPTLATALLSILLTLAQRPAWHHWGYAVAPLIAAVWLLAAQAVSWLGPRRNWMVGVLIAALAAPLCVASIQNRSPCLVVQHKS